MRTVVGIDPSLSGFAVATGTADGVTSVEEWKTKPAGSLVVNRMVRASRLVEGAVDLTQKLRAELVVIEGYSYGSAGNAKDIVELGGALRYRMWAAGLVVLEVPPSTLKKWATGKGNADKTFVATELTRLYGRAFVSNNQSDAFALCEIGRQVVGLGEPATAAQREAITKLGRPVALPSVAAAAE